MRPLLHGILILSSLAVAAQSTDSDAPSRRGEHLLFDTTRQQLLLLGGVRGTGRMELWRRDGGAWTRVPATPAPAARELGGAAWDSRRGRLVLFGGMGLDSREAAGGGPARRRLVRRHHGHSLRRHVGVRRPRLGEGEVTR